jgi:enoyl-CoA hydratase
VDERAVRLDVEGPILKMTIDREPARNSLSADTLVQLQEGLSKAEKDPAIRVVVITGAGDRVFCSGADLSAMAGDGILGGHEERRKFAAFLRRICEFGKPTIARVNGHALAGGLGVMLCCDLAVAADTAEFGTPEIDRGLFPMMVMAILQRHISRKRALEMVMLGERIKTATALEWGLVNRVVPRAELDRSVNDLAKKVAGKSTAILRLGRRAYFEAEDLALGPALELLASQLSLNVLTEDAAEGVSAFLEKRKPAWKDR